ncbi:MAG: methyltransferase domain-containing protein [Methylococcales bacterium]|jgi:ubiquinone/menaquinone biosynthesis C-methylase UbiE|nr:methyltransferase domain-containing protein [Methylococcales bacterium]MBT7409702.1 methyltransferase domain-containing protein [Methylococcales bacterium]
MWEQSKSTKRRYSDGQFHSRYFVGKGIDIGGKPDPMSQYCSMFPAIKSVRTWDIEDGDAQYMEYVTDNFFDFMMSSHCLEHMVDVHETLKNWIRIIKPGGFLIITVPDEDMYEMGQWPSQFNSDHKWTFTVHKEQSWSPKSINLLDLAIEFSSSIEIERIQLLNDFYRENLRKQNIDQTITPVAECAIEFIARKR